MFMKIFSPLFNVAAVLGLLSQIILLPGGATTHPAVWSQQQPAHQLKVEPAEASLEIGADGKKLAVSLNGQAVAPGSELRLSADSDLLEFDKSTFTLRLKPALKRLAVETTRKIKLR